MVCKVQSVTWIVLFYVKFNKTLEMMFMADKQSSIPKIAFTLFLDVLKKIISNN